MATAAEYTFMKAIYLAEQTRQTAKLNAFNTWAFGVGGALSTYVAALEAADNAYITAANSAASTAGAVGITVPNAGPASQAPVVILGGVGGLSGQGVALPCGSTTFGAVA